MSSAVSAVFREGAGELRPGMLPAALARVRACLGGWLLAPPGWVLLGTGTGTGPCLRWRHQPARREPALLLRAARQSIATQAGGLRAEKPGENSKQVSVQRARQEETLLSAARKGKAGGITRTCTAEGG